MAAYDFKVDFSPLGTLPGLAQGYKERVATEEALAGLKSGKYQDVQEAAAAILRGGGSIDQATKLYNAATANYAAKSRAAEMETYLKMIGGGGFAAALRGANPPPGTGGELPVMPGMGSVASSPLPSAAPESPAAPSPFPPPPTTSQIPPGTLGPRSEAPPSPTDAIITKAQAGMDPALAAPAIKLAGPPPTPDSAPALPAWMQGAQMPAPPAAAPAPAAPPADTGPPPPSSIPLRRADQSLADYQSQLEALSLKLPPKYANSPAGQILKNRLNDVYAQRRATPKEIEYRHALLQAVQAGEQPFTMQEYETKKEIAPKTYEEFQKGYAEVRNETKQAESFLQQAERMQVIMKQPEFTSGRGTAVMQHAMSTVTALHGALKAAGVDVPDISQIPYLSGLQKATALSETYSALANNALFKTLGGLGRQISDGDRIFMEKAYASLINTPAGNKLLLEIQMDIARRAVENGRAAEAYRKGRQDTRVTVHGMDEYIREHTDKNTVFMNKDGTLTEAGQKLQGRIDDILGPSEAGPPRDPLGLGRVFGSTPAPTPAAGAAPPAPPAATPPVPTQNPIPLGQIIRNATGIQPFFNVPPAPPPPPEDKQKRSGVVPRPYLLGPQ